MIPINTKEFEGLRLHVYTDTTGHRTIGYGHNLEGSNKNLMLMGVDIDSLINGDVDLTQQQADYLFFLDMKDAEKDVKDLVPNFDSLPLVVQDILRDLSFNMGKTVLSTFKWTLSAFNNEDWRGAALGLKQSRWYRQVGHRGKIIVGDLTELADG